MSLRARGFRHVIIVEPSASGHRPQYVRWLADGALRRGHQVTLASQELDWSSPGLSDLAAEHGDRFAIVRPRGRSAPQLGVDSVSRLARARAAHQVFQFTGASVA